MILVTGGTGLVGSHLLFKLVESGQPVRALYREGSVVENTLRIFCWRNPSGENLFDRIDWVEGDVQDVSSLQDAMQGVKEVFHCAALVSFDTREKKNLYRINELGTANMVNAALEAGVEWFCHVSSIAALGSPEENEAIDESTPWKADIRHSHYSISKFAAEREVWRGMEEGLKAVILNPSIILGPGPKGKASCRLFRAIRQGLRFHPGGSNGFVDVRDVVDAMLLLREKQLTGQRYVVSGINCSYRQLFEWMADELGKPAPTRLIPSYILKHAWLLDAIRGFLTASPREFTREMARSAIQDASYRNDKIKAETGISFRDIHDTLSYLKAYCFSQRNKYCGD